MRDLVEDLASLITHVMEDFPDVEPLSSPIPEVKRDDLTIINKMSKCPPLRKMHLELADINGLKILHSVFFPNPHYNLPIFGCDIVSTGKTITAAIVDVSPVRGFDNWKDIRELSNEYNFSERRPIPLWGDEIFSPHCKFMRINKTIEMANFYCLVMHYLHVYRNLVLESKPDPNWVNTMLRYDDQIHYCNQQKKNDKTRGILEKLFDKEWASNYIDTVLFDIPIINELQGCGS